MKVPPIVPSADELVDTEMATRRDSFCEADIAALVQRVGDERYAAGFAAALAMLREPSDELVTWVASGIWEIDAGWRGLWQEASQSSKDDYIACARAALPAAASALADSAKDES